jgi:hypothetical protein
MLKMFALQLEGPIVSRKDTAKDTLAFAIRGILQFTRSPLQGVVGVGK